MKMSKVRDLLQRAVDFIQDDADVILISHAVESLDEVGKSASIQWDSDEVREDYERRSFWLDDARRQIEEMNKFVP